MEDLGVHLIRRIHLIIHHALILHVLAHVHVPAQEAEEQDAAIRTSIIRI